MILDIDALILQLNQNVTTDCYWIYAFCTSKCVNPMTICDTLFVHCLHCYLTWFEVGETNIGSAMVARASRKIEQPLETTEPKTP